MKKFIIIFIVPFIIFFSHLPIKAYNSSPKEFVSELVNDALNKLSDKNLNEDQKKDFISKIAIENVDIRALGLYTLGELRKSAKEKKLKNIKQFLNYIFLKV